MVGAGVVVVAAVWGVVLTGRDAEIRPADPQQVRMGEACTQAAQVKLDPLVTLPSGEYTSEQRGVEWVVRTSVNHKTKWADHWYSVTCVFTAPGISVVSVETRGPVTR